MPEPHASIATTAATAAGAAVVSVPAGVVLGLPLEAVLFGLAGGLCAVWLDKLPRSVWARVATVAMGTVCAAAGAHPVAEVLHPAHTPTAMWVPLAALLIGYGAETILRTALQALTKRIEQLGGTGK
jgi:hypothetical protein